MVGDEREKSLSPARWSKGYLRRIARPVPYEEHAVGRPSNVLAESCDRIIHLRGASSTPYEFFCPPSVPSWPCLARRSSASLPAEVRVSGWFSPRMRRRRVSTSSSGSRAASSWTSARRSSARLLAELRVLGWSSPRMRWRVATSSSRLRAARSRRACACRGRGH